MNTSLFRQLFEIWEPRSGSPKGLQLPRDFPGDARLAPYHGGDPGAVPSAFIKAMSVTRKEVGCWWYLAPGTHRQSRAQPWSLSHLPAVPSTPGSPKAGRGLRMSPRHPCVTATMCQMTCGSGRSLCRWLCYSRTNRTAGLISPSLTPFLAAPCGHR